MGLVSSLTHLFVKLSNIDGNNYQVIVGLKAAIALRLQVYSSFQMAQSLHLNYRKMPHRGIDRFLDVNLSANLDLAAVLKPNSAVIAYNVGLPDKPLAIPAQTLVNGIMLQFVLVYVMPDAANHYLFKPIEPDALVDTIACLM